MSRRALLIGAQTFGLQGVESDIQAVKRALGRWGFQDIRVCWRAGATRDGILRAYEQLIDDTSPGDPVVVYYSGHGGWAMEVEGDATAVARTDRQFIVPADFGRPPDGGFRGITALELSVLLGRLTERTDNAVVILDCCHSGMISRTLGELRPRQLPSTQRVDITAHLRRLIEDGLLVGLARSSGNDKAVRLVACAADEMAFERLSPAASGACGLLTDAFVVALGEAQGTRVSWSRLAARVRQLVESRYRHQRPEVEGPSERVLFETATDDDPASLPVTVHEDEAVVHGAGLLGVQVGDEFAITSQTARQGPQAVLATLRIEAKATVTASGQLLYACGVSALPADARARRTKAVTPRVPVRLVCAESGPATSALAMAVEHAVFVRPAGPGEEAPLSVVVHPDATAVAHDAIGPLHPPQRLTADSVWRMVERLERAGRAITLLSIRDHRGWRSDKLEDAVHIEWGRVIGGRMQPLRNGARVDVGDHVYIAVSNRGNDPFYLSLVDVGLSYGISLLTGFAPSGIYLPPGGRYVLGSEDAPDGFPERLEGFEVWWLDSLPALSARPETVLAMVTRRPHDMTVLAQRPVRDDQPPQVRGEPPRSALADLVAHLAGGVARDVTLWHRLAEEQAWLGSVEFTIAPAA